MNTQDIAAQDDRTKTINTMIHLFAMANLLIAELNMALRDNPSGPAVVVRCVSVMDGLTEMVDGLMDLTDAERETAKREVLILVETLLEQSGIEYTISKRG